MEKIIINWKLIIFLILSKDLYMNIINNRPIAKCVPQPKLLYVIFAPDSCKKMKILINVKKQLNWYILYTNKSL